MTNAKRRNKPAREPLIPPVSEGEGERALTIRAELAEIQAAIVYPLESGGTATRDYTEEEWDRHQALVAELRELKGRAHILPGMPLNEL